MRLRVSYCLRVFPLQTKNDRGLCGLELLKFSATRSASEGSPVDLLDSARRYVGAILCSRKNTRDVTQEQ